MWWLLDTIDVHHVTYNVSIAYYFPSVHNMYMCQGSLDPINKCISGQVEELAAVVKLEFIHRSVICKGVGDLRMYDHGFIYVDIRYLYVA